MNKNLLLLASMLFFAPISAMHRHTDNVDHARAQQIAQSLAAGQDVSAQELPAKTQLLDVEKLQKKLPTVLQRYIASFFTPKAWYQKFYELAATYTVKLSDNLKEIERLSVHGTEILTLHEADTNIGMTTALHLYNHSTQAQEIIPINSLIKQVALSQHYIVYNELVPNNRIVIYDRIQKRSVLRFNLRHGCHSTSIAISPNEQHIVIGTESSEIILLNLNSDNIWQVAYRKEQNNRHLRYARVIQSITWSADNSRIVSACSDNSITIWETTTGEVLKRVTILSFVDAHGQKITAFGQISYAILSDDNNILVATCSHLFKPVIWDLNKDIVPTSDNNTTLNGCLKVHFGPQSGQITSQHRHGEQIVWDLASGKEVRRITGDKTKLLQKHISSLSTDGDLEYLVDAHEGNASVTIQLSIGSTDKILQKLSLEQISFIDDLMRARDKEVQKDQTKPLILDKAQQDLFKTLPAFVQKALTINLNLPIDIQTTKEADTGDRKEK